MSDPINMIKVGKVETPGKKVGNFATEILIAKDNILFEETSLLVVKKVYEYIVKCDFTVNCSHEAFWKNFHGLCLPTEFHELFRAIVNETHFCFNSATFHSFVYTYIGFRYC